MAEPGEKSLKRADGDVAPQGYDEAREDWDFIQLRDGRQLVRDDKVEKKLDELIDATGNTEVKFPDDFPDKNVKSELESMKETQKDMMDAVKNTNETLEDVIKDGSVNTQLTGSLIEEEVILKRKSRNESESKKIDVPERAKGVIFQCNANALTGEFGEGEGYGMRVRSLLDSNPTTINWWRDINVGRAGNPHQNLVVVWYLGTNDDFIGDTSYGNKETKIVSLPLPPSFYLTLKASGEFEDGEGISNELKAFWYY